MVTLHGCCSVFMECFLICLHCSGAAYYKRGYSSSRIWSGSFWRSPSWGVWQAFYRLCWCRTEPLQQQQPIFLHTSPGRHGLRSTVPLICLQTLWCLLFILCLLSSSPVQCPQLMQQCVEWAGSIRKVVTRNQVSILCRGLGHSSCNCAIQS